MKKKEIFNLGAFSIESLGFWAIAALCYYYSLRGADFAERHISIPGLGFPVFIGEICMFILGVLYAVSRVKDKRPVSKYELIGLLYFLFVVLKALYGYGIKNLGPLAFRHAALFYYPIFSVFCFHFLKKTKLSFSARVVSIFFVLLTLSCRWFLKDFFMTGFLLALFLIYSLPKPYQFIKYSLLIILAVVSPWPRVLFFNSRTCLVSNFLTIVSLAALLTYTAFVNSLRKLFYSISAIFICSALILKFADQNAIKSLTNIKPIMEQYEENIRIIEKSSLAYTPSKPARTQVYHAQTEAKEQEEAADAYERERYIQVHAKMRTAEAKQSLVTQAAAKTTSKTAGKTTAETTAETTAKTGDRIDYKPIIEQSVRAQGHRGPDLGTNYTNIIFRLLIWKDMLSDIIKEKPILGFNFGKPFLSKSLQITGWGYDEWTRDGWISAHNSYLQTIYYAGLIGAGGIFFVFYLLIYSIRKSVRVHSVQGIFLCGILFNWLTSSFFSVILELPYFAIPFWSLFGATCFYITRLNQENENSSYP